MSKRGAAAATAYSDIRPGDFTPLRFGNIREESPASIWAAIVAHPAYRQHCNHGRRREAEFRRRWVDPIPAAGPFPYPVEWIEQARAFAQAEEAVLRRSSSGLRA